MRLRRLNRPTSYAGELASSHLGCQRHRSEPDDPIGVGGDNECNGDVVALTGETHILIHSTQSTAGPASYFLDYSSKYDGIGLPSGVKYKGSTNRLFDAFFTGNPLPSPRR